MASIFSFILGVIVGSVLFSKDLQEAGRKAARYIIDVFKGEKK